MTFLLRDGNWAVLWMGHSMLSQPLDGRHVTDFAEILHTTWDMKKIPEPKDECSETSKAVITALESFRYFEISRTVPIFQGRSLYFKGLKLFKDRTSHKEAFS